MIDHLVVNCADYVKSQEFYDRVLAVLGYSRQQDFGEAIGYGPDGAPEFWIAEGAGMGPTGRRISPLPPPATTRFGRFTMPPSSWARSRYTLRDCGRSTTRATSRPSSGTPTATMSKPSATGRVDGYV